MTKNTIEKMKPNLEYIEIQPHERLKKYIQGYWTLKGEKHSYRQLLLGDTKTKIIISKKTKIDFITKFNIYHKKDKNNHLDEITETENICKIESSAVIIGPSIDYSLLCIEGELDIFVIEFTPIGASIILNETMSEFAFKCISSAQSKNKVLKNIEKILTNTTYKDEIENYLINQIKSSQRDIDNIDIINNITNKFKLSENFSLINNNIFISERQIRRIFKKYVGVTPKEILRICRAQNAFNLILKNNNDYINSLCLEEKKFTDQSHFIKEFNRFCGHTPSALIEHSRKVVWNQNIAFFESKNQIYNICKV